MIALPYVFLIVIISSFGVGFGTAYKIEQSEVLKLKLAIAQANLQAGELLHSIKAHVEKSQQTAKLYNEKLDQANAQAIKTINGYHDQLNTLRLRDPYVKHHCPDSLPKSTTTRINKKDEQDRAELSDQLTKFLQSESYRADKTAIEKNTLLDFVRANCGIR